MKKLSFIFILYFLGLSACNFLDEKPEDFLSPANFYQSEADAEAAIIAAYDELGYYLSNMWEIGGITADLLEPGAGAPQSRLELQTYSYDPTQGDLNSLWRNVYQGINIANTAIDQIGPSGLDADIVDPLIGEAKFLRALYYFDLARIFGDVPLLTSETSSLGNLQVSRSPQSEVYQQVVNDLEDAIELLPESRPGSQTGRATTGAALALLTKVQLYRGEYQAAASAAEQVMAQGYALMPIEELWDPAFENGPEHIFSVQYLAGVQGSNLNELFGVRGAPSPYTGFSAAWVDESFANSFAEEDQRKPVSILEVYINRDGDTVDIEPHVLKYFNPDGPSPGDTDTDWPVIRYADILLMYAEALNNVNNGPNAAAYDAVNQVRARAGVGPLPAGLGQAAFSDALLQERAWELCFEGHRWFDLRRFDQLVPVMNAYGQPIQAPKHLLFPIPQRELDVNNELSQNPDY